MGSWAKRPFGVAPTALPIWIMLAHPKTPGTNLVPPGVGASVTRAVNNSTILCA